MYYTFSDTSFNTFRSIEQRSMPDMKALAETLLQDAIDFNRVCSDYQRRVIKQLVLSNFVMIVVIALQVYDVIPGWIPVWYVAMLCYDDAWNRLPELTPWTRERMREADAAPADEDDYRWSNLNLVLMFVIWGVGGWYTGNWLGLSIGTTLCCFFLYFAALRDFNKVVNKNLRAYEAFVTAVVRMTKKNEISFLS